MVSTQGPDQGTVVLASVPQSWPVDKDPGQGTVVLISTTVLTSTLWSWPVHHRLVSAQRCHPVHCSLGQCTERSCPVNCSPDMYTAVPATIPWSLTVGIVNGIVVLPSAPMCRHAVIWICISWMMLWLHILGVHWPGDCPILWHMVLATCSLNEPSQVFRTSPLYHKCSPSWNVSSPSSRFWVIYFLLMWFNLLAISFNDNVLYTHSSLP